MYNTMLMTLLYMYIDMCQSRCIKYDVLVNTVVCLLKCIYLYLPVCHRDKVEVTICRYSCCMR